MGSESSVFGKGWVRRSGSVCESMTALSNMEERKDLMIAGVVSILDRKFTKGAWLSGVVCRVCFGKGMSVGRNFGHPKLTRPRGQMYCPSTEMVSSL